MKRLCDFYYELWMSLRKEVLPVKDQSPIAIQRDGDRLLEIAAKRGLRVFTLDLPALGSWYDLGLSTGRLVRTPLPLTRRVGRKTQIPRFMGEIVSRVFDSNGLLRNDADVTAVRALRQLCLLGKKARIDCDENKILRAIEEFHRTDGACPFPSRYWREYEALPDDADALSFCERLPLLGTRDDLVIPDPNDGSRTLSVGPILHEFFDRIASELGPFKASEWRPKHGPGAVSDSRGPVDKYVWPTWSEELSRVFPYAEYGFANFADWAARGQLHTEIRQAEANLIAVPKTQKGPRLIASEPTANQWCQQAIKAFLVKRVAQTVLGDFVSFRDQAPNQLLALKGSADGTTWTIDLSEASDRVSTYLVERAFRRNRSLLEALIATRTPYLRDSSSGQPKLTRLNKFACMGSACTFPVQTLLYLGIALTATALCKGWSVDQTLRYLRLTGLPEVRIFGDDIIVPYDVGPYTVSLLHVLGFKVNTSKTHTGSNFRESCGVDAFRGHDVTPVYVMQVPRRSKPESLASSVDTAKNFFRKGLVQTAETIWRAVEVEGIKLPTYGYDSGAFGRIGYTEDLSHLKRRWNKSLQQTEVRVPVVMTSNPRMPTFGGTALLQYFTERPTPDENWVHGYSAKTSIKVRWRWEVLERAKA